MKKTSVILVATCLLIDLTQAQTLNRAAPNPSALPAPTPYTIVEQGANHRVWQRETYEQTPDGSIVPQVHKYTELATGMNYLKNGRWVESKEEIDILPNGTAAATQGQHQVYFPGDIYNGVIELVTPDGKHLRSRPVGLSYDDGSKTVLIGELKDSAGYLVGSNQVIYPDVFTDLKADLRYTYTKAGFEQDIILREQPPDPASLGLNPKTTRLQVLTEFFNPPQPRVTAMTMPTKAGNLEDDSLSFGTMQVRRGKAFLLGTNSPAVRVNKRVYKRWLELEGRQFLVEEVPVASLANGLDTLPQAPPQANSVTTRHIVSKNLILPPQRLARTTPKTMFVAQATPPSRGLVLDYVILNSYASALTLQGDTTYYVSGGVYVDGVLTIEGGTVVKYPASLNGSLDLGGQLNCKTGPYRPAIFTAVDDNSVGETISGSTGNPTNYYSNGGLWMDDSSATLTNLRFRYLYTAIVDSDTGSYTNINIQVVNCRYAFDGADGSTITVDNGLFFNTGDFFNDDGCDWTFVGNQLTVHQCGSFNLQGDGFIALTNSLFVAVPYSVTNLTLATNAVVWLTNDDGGIFQTVGAGAHYLATNSLYRGAGTTNVDPTLLADIRTKTTYPPMVYSNVTITSNVTLGLQAPRDTNATPALGYHYDPIDYITETYGVTNATLTIASGTVIACYNDNAGIWLQDGSSIVSVGTPLTPNRFVWYLAVQEQPISIGPHDFSGNMYINSWHYGSVGPNGTFQFSQFVVPAGGTHQFYSYGNWAYNSLLVQNCELWNGPNNFNGANSITANFQNTLFARSTISAASSGKTNYSLSFSNSLFWNTTVALHSYSNSNIWSLFNNDFDSCTISATGNGVLTTNGYNAYLNCSGRLTPTNANDIVLTNSLAYQSGPLGGFYQPTDSRLIDAGSTTADQVGLYHFTTQTNQVPETNSIVDIGYHYVAVDTNGIPLDSNEDGIPDYLEDANGNGIVDNGETNWALAILTQPQSQAVIQGSNVTFSVTVSGTGPFTYQWQLNGTNLDSIITTVAGGGNAYPGNGGAATNASLRPWGGVAVDASGNLFIADSWDNNLIRKVGTNGIITTVAGGGNAYPGNGGAATNASLGYPSGVAVDASGNLFFADLDNNYIRKVDTNGIITTVAGNGDSDYYGDNGPATNASLYCPIGVAVDASGNLFIADMNNYRIRKVNTNGIITTVAGNGNYGYSGDGGQATNASLYNPYRVAVDASGNLFIADTYNQRIRKVDTNGIITTVAGGGNDGLGDGGAATNASLHNPWGVAVDASGNLFIADWGNNRIREVVLSASDPTLTLCNVTTNNAGNYTVVITNPYGNVTSSVATLTVASSPIIYQIIRNANASVMLYLLTTPNTSSRVLATTNLAPPVVWQPIYSNVAGANGAWQFTDRNASNYPVRFYRSSTP